MSHCTKLNDTLYSTSSCGDTKHYGKCINLYVCSPYSSTYTNYLNVFSIFIVCVDVRPSLRLPSWTTTRDYRCLSNSYVVFVEEINRPRKISSKVSRGVCTSSTVTGQSVYVWLPIVARCLPNGFSSRPGFKVEFLNGFWTEGDFLDSHPSRFGQILDHPVTRCNSKV